MVAADDQVVVVDKPAGLVVHPGAGHRRGTMAAGLLARFPELAELVATGVSEPHRPGIVHRLDKGTSGAAGGRPYGRVGGLARPGWRPGRWSAAMWPWWPGAWLTSGGWWTPPSAARPAPHQDDGGRRRPAGPGRALRGRASAPPRATPWWTWPWSRDRTHQIRVHLATIGHPVIGDDRYGRPNGPRDCPRPPIPARRRAGLRPPGHRGPGPLRVAAARPTWPARLAARRGGRATEPPQAAA